MIVSIFNDVIGPVMRGPSSSHCAAALRIGRIARDLMAQPIASVLLEFDRNGSLPQTHDSQGSDMGLFGGLLGWEATDERLPNSMETMRSNGVEIKFTTIDCGDKHPNTYRLTLTDTTGQKCHVRAISTGGGMIEVIAIDEFSLSIAGDCFETLIWIHGNGQQLRETCARHIDADDIQVHRCDVDTQLIEIKAQHFINDDALAILKEELGANYAVRDVRRVAPVLPVLSRQSTSVPFTTCAEMLDYDAGRGTPLWKLAIAYESARSGLDEETLLNKMVEIIAVVRQSISQGIAGTTYEDRVLGHQSGVFQKRLQAGNLLNAGALNRMVLYVTALMEVKSAMGIIVAAPTAGACAALPAAVIAMGEELGLDDIELARAMMASGLIGVFIATRWTFAAEVGGCQAEGGSAASMAAAALVTLANGTLAQSIGASSMALQSMIGLICDPVANRVEVPCLGKNVMAAGNALSCANMSLSDFDPVIPLDEVIETAKRVSAQMPRELRCTSLGGLAITPTAQALEKRLTANKPGCGNVCGC